MPNLQEKLGMLAQLSTLLPQGGFGDLAQLAALAGQQQQQGLDQERLALAQQAQQEQLAQNAFSRDIGTQELALRRQAEQRLQEAQQEAMLQAMLQQDIAERQVGATERRVALAEMMTPAQMALLDAQTGVQQANVDRLGLLNFLLQGAQQGGFAGQNLNPQEQEFLFNFPQ